MKHKEYIRVLLRSAFPRMAEPPDLRRGDLPDDQRIELRRELPRFVPSDLQKILPKVLEDLLDTHTGDPIARDDAEFVLMKLNVDRYVSEETERAFAEIWGQELVESDREANRFIREATAYDFDLLTREQASAIYEWLLLAESWPDFRDCQDDLQGALSYWRAKANVGK